MLLIVGPTDARVIPSGLPPQGWHGSWNHPFDTLDVQGAVDKAVETVDSRRLLRRPYELDGPIDFSAVVPRVDLSAPRQRCCD